MILTGGTLIAGAAALKEAGATEVYALRDARPLLGRRASRRSAASDLTW